MKHFTTIPARIVAAVLTALSAMMCAMAGERTEVSLLTCYPGPEVYELCGHSALRICTYDNEGRLSSDSTWNWGVFNFAEPNFVYRFVKGETDYMMAGVPTEWFLPEYVARGSKVVQQKLSLTEDEAGKLRAMLQSEQLNDHGRYRYNYVLDNCATRITDRLDEVTDGRIVYPDTLPYKSFRDEMRAYHGDYPWYQFGIDLALGAGIDRPLQRRQDMFVPVELMHKAGGAHFSDGRGLVEETVIISEGYPGATLPPTPFWLTPLFWSVVAFALAALVCGIDLWRRKRSVIIYALWFGVLGIAGCIIAFLVFVSEHEATSPNALILWLNPLQLIVPALIWNRMTRPIVTAWTIASGAVLLGLLICWPFQSQSANTAFFPLMAATLLYEATWSYLSLSHTGADENGKRKSPRKNYRRK